MSSQATPSAAEHQEQAPRALLPGELYRRANAWWWRVKLPGEERVQPRPLRSEQAQTAAGDRESAEKIAFALWERAVQEDATRQVKRESTEKIERLKAQFLDRVRHFTELVETAHAQIEAQAKARAEAEAKLAQMIQAAAADARTEGQEPQTPAPPGRSPEPRVPPGNVQVPAAAPVIAALPEPVVPFPAPTGVVGPVLPVVAREPSQQQPPLIPAPIAQVVPVPPPATGTCECCEATGIALACLTRIDSGQHLCPRCLAALRIDATQTDPDVPN